MTTPTTVQVKLQLRADTAANWTSINPTLLANELGRETDTGKIKIGNGSTAWNSLAYQAWATLPIAVNVGGTGQTTYTNGQLLIGNTTGNTLTKATLTAGAGVAITNGTGTITVAASGITDAQIAAGAEIAVSKLADGASRQLLQTDAAGTGVEWTNNIDVPGTLDVTGAAVFDSTVAVTGTLTKSGSNVVTVGDTGTVTSTMIADGTIVNADINTSAAIAHSKLANIAAASVLLGNASNVPTATAVTGDVTISSSGITAIGSGVIVDADISASAEIAVNKLADGSARQLLQTDAAGTGVEWASNIDIPGTLDVTDAATFDNNVIIQGDLTVNGTETIINTQTLDVEDKNIVIGKVITPTDITADGGGITLKGTTDKTINWIDSTDAWTLSEHISIASGKEYRIAGTKVLDATSLGSAVVSSSLTSVGTIGTGTWQGTTVATGYGGTGQTTYSNGQLLIGKTDGTLAKATLTASTGVTITNADGNITISATGSGGTVTAVTGTSPIASTGGTTPDISIQDGTTAQKGAVQLEDSTSSTSTTKAATPASVKAAYDLAAAALPKAGGTITGNLEIGTTGSISFEGATANDFETTIVVVDPTADQTITLPDVTGTVVTTGDTGTVTSTMILDGTILNADINASAAIADTKLATIATAGKVSNSATTATDANTASAIVARDGSGNFSAGTITAALTGAASANMLKAGDTMTGVLAVTAGTAALPAITFTGDLNTGIYSPGADQVAISTNGARRLLISNGQIQADTLFSVAMGGAGFQTIFRNGANEDNYIAHGASGFTAFRNHNGSEYMRLDSAGRLGLGTSSPDAKLHLQVSDSTSYSPLSAPVGRTGSDVIYIENTDNTVDGYAGIFFQHKSSGVAWGRIALQGNFFGDPQHAFVFTMRGASGTTNNEKFRIGNTGTISFLGDTNTFISGDGSDALLCTTNGSERVRIDSSGRLLIGTSSATNNIRLNQKLAIVHSGVGGYPGIGITGYIGTVQGDAPFIDLTRSRGTTDGSMTAVASGDTLGYLAFRGADGTSFVDAASITAVVDGTPGAYDMPGRLVFSTSADGSSSPTERMRINALGNAFIGGGGATTQAATRLIITNPNTTESTSSFIIENSSFVASIYCFNVNTGGVSTQNAAMWVQKSSSTSRSINAAGTINASGADYAEYMVKAGNFTIAKGDVCGITANGLLTLDYSNAVSFVVKSTNPSYVGGDTWGSEDAVGKKPDADDLEALAQWEANLEAARQTVDRIAFAGQVPVNVTGAVPGQYIVPIATETGGITGVAKNEGDLTLAEYMRSVGKVIAIEDDDRARIIVKAA